MDSNEKWIREQEAPRDLLPGVSGHLQRKQYEPQYCMDSREGKASYAAQDVRNLSRLEVVKGTLMMIEYVTLDDWHSSFAVFFWQSAQDAACLTDKRLVYIPAAFA